MDIFRLLDAENGLRFLFHMIVSFSLQKSNLRVFLLKPRSIY